MTEIQFTIDWSQVGLELWRGFGRGVIALPFYYLFYRLGKSAARQERGCGE
jgi:hypothetical protein